MSLHFADVWEEIAGTVPSATALVHGNVRRTWADFDNRAARISAALACSGIGHDDKVAIYLHNCNEYLEAQYGIFKRRACPINVNYRYLEDELIYLLDNADADALFFQSCYAERIQQIRHKLPRLKLLVQIDDGTGDLIRGAVDYESLIESHDPEPPQARDDDDLYMLYTGGTTGMPKGVMYRNGGMCGALMGGYVLRGLEMPESADQVGRAVEQLHATGDVPRSLVACPLMHGTGMWIGSMIPLNLGGTVITFPNLSFDPDVLWSTVEREAVTDITIVGDAFAKPMLQALESAERRGRPYDISSVKLVISSGVMWTAQVKEGLLRYGNMVLYDAMGSTEGSMGTSITTRDEINQTAKFQVAETTRVFTDDDREVEPGSGEIGRIAAGGNVPLGYYKDSEKSALTFREIDGVRYSFPGDYATVEADGTIILLGRGSMCINTAGEKVFPEEVEETIKLHPAVFDSLVVGLPDLRFGERVVAVASCREGKSVTADDLISFCRSHLAGYKLPKQVVFVPMVQRTSSGKADYQWAKETAVEMLGESA